MKKVFLAMLVLALGFGTMSFTANSNCSIKTSVKDQKEVQVLSTVVFTSYTAPWLGICCESAITAVERDLAKRGYPATTHYMVNSTTSNTVTYSLIP